MQRFGKQKHTCKGAVKKKTYKKKYGRLLRVTRPGKNASGSPNADATNWPVHRRATVERKQPPADRSESKSSSGAVSQAQGQKTSGIDDESAD